MKTRGWDLERVAVVLGAALCLAFVAAPFALWEGGVLDDEAIAFLRNYWSERGVLQKVFDPARNDFGAYQARELSYAIDLLDAQWLKLLMASGRVLLVPPSAVVGSLLIVAVVAWGARTGLPGLPAPIVLLGLALFLSNFAVVTTHAFFYRSAKSYTALLLLVALFHSWRELRTPKSRPAFAGAVLFVVAALLGLLDRQGFAYALVLAASLALVWVWTRRGLALLLGAVASVAVSVIYDLWLGPWLIHALNGYWPSFHYQRLPWHKLANPRFYREGAELLLGYASLLLGGLPPALLVALGLAGGAALLLLRRRRRSQGGDARLALALVALVLASQVAMFAIMIMRSRTVYVLETHRLYYYPLPFQALLLFGLMLLLERLVREGQAVRRTAALVLGLLVLSNVALWPEIRQVMADGPWVGWTSSQTRLWRTSLLEGRAHPRLYSHYRELFWECRALFPAFAPAPGPEVGEGSGIWTSSLRGERVFAWARQTARLDLRTEEPGTYRLAARLLLRPGDVLSVVQAGGPLLSVPRNRPDEGPESLALTLRLPRGRSEIELRSSLPEVLLDPDRDQVGAFGLFLPVLLYRQGDAEGAALPPP